MVQVIFCTGVHGVGKSTFCEALKQEKGIDFYDASKIISDEKKVEIATKQIDERHLGDNQKYLLMGLEKIKDEIIILTGHTVFINKTGNGFIKLPIETFEKLNILKIVLLIDDPRKIADRLTSRDGKSYDIKFIGDYQIAEIEYSEHITNVLGVDCEIINYSNS